MSLSDARHDDGSADDVPADAVAAWQDSLERADWRTASRQAWNLGWRLRMAYRLLPAAVWLERSVLAATRAEDHAFEAIALADLAGTLVEAGDWAAGGQAIRRCVVLLDRTDLEAVTRREVEAALAITYWILGLTAQAVRLQRHVLASVAPTPEAYDLAEPSIRNAVLDLANTLRYHVDECEGIDDETRATALEEARFLADRIEQDLAHLEGEHAVNGPTIAGIIRFRSGDLDAAATLLQRAIESFPGEHAPFRTTAVAELAAVRHAQGLREEAADLAATARRLLWDGRTDPVQLASWEHLALMRLAPLTGAWQEAFECQGVYTARLRLQLQHVLDAEAEPLSDGIGGRVLALQNADLRERTEALVQSVAEIRDVANRDPLTGLLNRRALETEFSRLLGEGRFALAMIDVDHFKQVNDTYSHVVGDEVLRTVARILVDEGRNHDVVARYGGEEMAVLIAGADGPQALAAAERLRAAVESHDWPSVAAGLAVTVSIGVSAVRATDDFRAAVTRSDELLYVAKRSGRNRVCAP